MRTMGLAVGGKARRDMAAYSIFLPLLSYHKPSKRTWSWAVEFYRYKKETGCKHSFRIFSLGNNQRRTILDTRLGAVQLIRQK